MLKERKSRRDEGEDGGDRGRDRGVVDLAGPDEVGVDVDRRGLRGGTFSRNLL